MGTAHYDEFRHMETNRRPPSAPGHQRQDVSRRRASRRTYLVRRVAVLLVLLALIAGIVRGARALLGSEPASSANSAPATAITTTITTTITKTSPDVEASNSAAVSSAPVPVPVPEPSTTTSLSTPVDNSRTPTTADPARVLIAGDSDAGSFGPYLQKLVEGSGVAKTTLDYKTSSGLSRPDFFDWPAHFADQLGSLNPDIVIVTFGGNDGQTIHGMSDPVDSDGWRAEYAKRVGAAMDQLSADGRTLIWVGIPNGPSDDFTARLRVQNEVVAAQVAAHPNVVFVDTWNRFTGLDGGYAEYVIDPRDGLSKDVRGGDGFHLNTNGAEILA